MKSASIGIFDSGFGGLTVMNAVTDLLPNEHITYFADTANLPYGNKTPEEILNFSYQSIEFLANQGIKLLVIACHTSCATALPFLRKQFSFPILAISDSGIKELLSQKKTDTLAFLATQTTVNSQLYQQALQSKFSKCTILAIACPLFVPLLEMGYVNQPLLTQSIIHESLHPLKTYKDPIDAVLLACTHYPLLKNPIQKELGLQTLLIDPSASCAQEAKQMLIQNNLINETCSPGKHLFYVSNNPDRFQSAGKLFSNFPLDPVFCVQESSLL